MKIRNTFNFQLSTLNSPRIYFAAATTLRPLYVPHFGHARCERTAAPHAGQVPTWARIGFSREATRSRLRRLDTLFLGLAIFLTPSLYLVSKIRLFDYSIIPFLPSTHPTRPSGHPSAFRPFAQCLGTPQHKPGMSVGRVLYSLLLLPSNRPRGISRQFHAKP